MIAVFHQVWTWCHRRQERKARERSETRFNSGFQWAMKELTHRTLTCDEVCDKCCGVFDYTDFDRGGLHAVSVFRTVEQAAVDQFIIIEQHVANRSAS
jgi:hypothetical protein